MIKINKLFGKKGVRKKLKVIFFCTESQRKMHLAASEVSSTTNPITMETNNNSVNNDSNNNKESSGSANNNNGSKGLQPLTAESLAERTIEGLMAEHPGELVRTGSPHVVSKNIRDY